MTTKHASLGSEDHCSTCCVDKSNEDDYKKYCLIDVAQVDDDVIVNVDALATYLRERRTQGNLYMVFKFLHLKTRRMLRQNARAWGQNH